MDSALRVTIGQRIRNQRQNLKLSQDSFSERMGIAPQFLSDVERGKKSISAETLYRLCKEFDISPEYILFGSERETIELSPFAVLLNELTGTPNITILENILRSYVDTIHITEQNVLDRLKNE